jgi:hypothetical protein
MHFLSPENEENENRPFSFYREVMSSDQLFATIFDPWRDARNEFWRRIWILSLVIGNEGTRRLLQTRSVSSRIMNDEFFDRLLFTLFFQL